jgi:FkbM family methyltransferase
MESFMADAKEVYGRLEERYFGDGMHERGEIEKLPSILKGVSTFVDVGSSLGQYVYFAGKILSNATFYCIEPDEFKVKRLRELTAKWQDETGNCYHIINKATSDKDGKIRFLVPSDHDSSGALFRKPHTSPDPSDWIESEVECTTLDSLLDGVNVDFLKMDIEGAEHRTLLGAKKILELGNAKFLIEIAPWGDSERSYKPSYIFKLMSRYGYGFKIYETHYLFYKAENTFVSRIKNFLMGFMLDHPSIKNTMKKILFLFRKITSH